MRASSIVPVVILMLSVIAAADTLYVPQNYGTIQEGIHAAMEGDTVLVAPSTYYENIDFMGKMVIVKSLGGPESTCIDGGSSPYPELGSVVSFKSAERPGTILEGFTIRNGFGTRVHKTGQYDWVGGGVYCFESSPTLIDLIITDNHVMDWGGGVYAELSMLTMSRLCIEGNSAPLGGGGLCGVQSDIQIS